ncbi:MAG: NADH-quinone oxidoreductase subunit D [Candidatus Njordarchaeia archaeon]|nr:MAG: NADH-quinone oxidoreductase subunit D [Chloroflexota bacterium]
MARRISDPIKAGINLFSSSAMTYKFPPEMPLTKGFRGRHLLDTNKCTGCKLCYNVCPNKAIEMVEMTIDNKKVLRPEIDYGKCCFCGLCVDVCPPKALTFTNFPMLVTTDKKTLIYTPEMLSKPPKLEMKQPPKIKGIGHWARSRSLWVLNFFTGCCFIEAVPWVGSGFDMERFGLIPVASPRHADVLIVGGYVTVKTLRRIIEIYELMPKPKFVIAFGNCPITGGTYWDSYSTIKRLDKYIPVDIWIGGCPPRPEAIGLAVVEAMHAVQSGYTGKEEFVNKEAGEFEVPETQLETKDEEFTLTLGPCHPATGNFDMKLTLNGEVVKDAKANPGYLHRGFEKLMEYRTWWQNIMLVQRVCVLDGASYELAYVGSVEKIAGINVPERAKYLRVIQAELSRIQSHLLNIGLVGAATGFDTIERVTWGDREKILLLIEKLTGGRIYSIYNFPGGVRRDISEDFKKSVIETMDFMRKRLELYDKLLFNNEIFIERTIDIGKLSQEQAIKYDVTGPNLRASGIDFDVRKQIPYEAYNEIDFKVITSKKGDAYHRVLCRRKEIDESINIIEQALDQLPNGPIEDRKMKNGRKMMPFVGIPEGESIHCVESARGELCFYSVSNGKPLPYRVKIRGPTFDTILVMLPQLLKGAYIADVPVIYWSLDNCPADHDR